MSIEKKSNIDLNKQGSAACERSSFFRDLYAIVSSSQFGRLKKRLKNPGEQDAVTMLLKTYLQVESDERFDHLSELEKVGIVSSLVDNPKTREQLALKYTKAKKRIE